MKTIPAIAAAACCAVLATSCSKSEAGAGAAVRTIGLSIPAADHGWTGGVVFWAQRAKSDLEKENPGTRVLLAASKSSEEQASAVENMLVQGVDALVILPNEPGPLTPVCRQAAAKKIPLVVVDRGLSDPDLATLSVVGDNPGFGRVSAERLVAALGGKGDVALMHGVLCQVDTDRVEAFKKVLADNPGIDLVDEGVSDWSTEKGLSLMEAFLQKHPKLDAVWTGDDDVLLGALQAYRESGRTDLKALLGGGGSKAVVKMILYGDPLVSQTVTYPPKMIYVAARRAAAILAGETPAGKVEVVPAEVIDASNAAENYFPDSAY